MTTAPRALLLLLAACAASTDCAFFNRQNTPLLNAVERSLVPESEAARVLASPVVIPVGMTAGALDVFVVHPISVLPDAADDVRSFWKWRPDGYVTEMGVLAPRAVVTPAVFGVSFLGRSAFDLGSSTDAGSVPSPPDIDTAIRLGDRETIRGWLRSAGSDAADTQRIRTIVGRYPADPELLRLAVPTLLSSGPEGERFLLDLLRKGDTVQEPVLLDAFASHRSVAAGEILLEQLFSGSLPPDRARRTLDALFQINDPGQVERLLRKLKQ